MRKGLFLSHKSAYRRVKVIGIYPKETARNVEFRFADND